MTKHLILLITLLTLALGCRPLGGDDDDDGGGGDALLSIPAVLVDRISAEDLNQLSERIRSTPACQKPSGGAIDITLAQACVLYHDFYLFPDFLPESLDAYDTTESFVSVMSSQDKFTVYISAAQFSNNVAPSLQGERALIGMTLEISNDATSISSDNPLKILRVLPYTRAWIDGLQAEDQILQVNGESLEGLNLSEAIAKLPKSESSSVSLVIRRGGEEQTIETASETHISKLMDGNVGYLNVREYTTNTGSRVIEDYETLEQEAGESLTKLILDLRGNGGGATSAARKLTDFLINQDDPSSTNLIMSTSDKNGAAENFYLGSASDKNIIDFSKTNFVVLMDEDSASSSEITINALTHYETATRLGRTSFGKGVQQTVFQLIDGSGIFVTSDRIQGPADSSWHLTGMVPDICIDNPDLNGDLDGRQVPGFSEDPQLLAAVEFLNNGSVESTSECVENTSSSRLLLSGRHDPWLSKLLGPWD